MKKLMNETVQKELAGLVALLPLEVYSSTWSTCQHKKICSKAIIRVR
jgi:hypothetical protein